MLMERDRRLNVMISEAEWQMLQRIADREGVTASDVVRMFIRERHMEMFGERSVGTKGIKK